MKEYSQEEIDKEVKAIYEKMKKPNILICGQTGAGKSSVVNWIFKEKIAEVGEYEPCTKDISYYKGQDVNIFDSEGYEIGTEKQKHYFK